MRTKTLNINEVIALPKGKNLHIEAVTKKITKTNNNKNRKPIKNFG